MKAIYSASISALVALLVLIAVPCNARADTLYNNINSSQSGHDPIAGFGPLADSFSTGGSAFLLSEVTLLLNATTPSDGGSVLVQLLSDSSTSPGSVLDTIGTLIDSSLTGSYAKHTVSLSAPYSLSADTRYRIELSTSNDSSANWAWSLDQTAQGVAGEYLFYKGGVFGNYDGPYQMQLSNTETPEPGTLGLLGIGLLCMAGLFRRKVLLQ